MWTCKPWTLRMREPYECANLTADPCSRAIASPGSQNRGLISQGSYRSHFKSVTALVPFANPPTANFALLSKYDPMINKAIAPPRDVNRCLTFLILSIIKPHQINRSTFTKLSINRSSFEKPSINRSGFTKPSINRWQFGERYDVIIDFNRLAKGSALK